MRAMLWAAAACCAVLAGCDRGPVMETRHYDDGAFNVTEVKTQGLFGPKTCRILSSKLVPTNTITECD
jgi:hypothetical protein